MRKDDGYSYDTQYIRRTATTTNARPEPFHVANDWLQSELDLPLDEPSPRTAAAATAAKRKASLQAIPVTSAPQRRESCWSCEHVPELIQLPKARTLPRRSTLMPLQDSVASAAPTRPPPRKPTLFAMPSHLMGSSSSSSPPLSPTKRVSSLPARALPPLRKDEAALESGERAQPQSLNRAVNGLENLMDEALHVARDAAQSGRNEEVAEILNSATMALRKASTVQGNMDQGRMSRPLRLSPAESKAHTDSDSIGSDSDASSMRSTRHSIETAPTVFTMTPQPSQQPVLKERNKSIDRLPRSQKASFESVYDRDTAAPTDLVSMTSTPPRLYQPPSADSIVRDFAYAKQKTARTAAARAQSISHGAAEDYYGDAGQSVNAQPGVRPSRSSPSTLDKPLPPLPDAHRPSVVPPHHGRRQHVPVRRVEHVPTNTIPRRASTDYDNVNRDEPTPRRRHGRRHHHHHLSNFLESPDYRDAPTNSRSMPDASAEMKRGDSFVTVNRYVLIFS